MQLLHLIAPLLAVAGLAHAAAMPHAASAAVSKRDAEPGAIFEREPVPPRTCDTYGCNTNLDCGNLPGIFCGPCFIQASQPNFCAPL